MDTGQGPRDRLLSAALRVLEAEGPDALQARRLAGEIGASTMAVYTHFGALPALVEAVVRDGLLRFADHVRAVPETEDPVADLMARGMAFGEWALQNPQLYRLMYERGRTWTLPEGAETFGILHGGVERALAAGRFRHQDATLAATQILGSTHGFLMLLMGGFITDMGEDPAEVIAALSVDLMVGLGDRRERAERSFAAARARRESSA